MPARALRDIAKAIAALDAHSRINRCQHITFNDKVSDASAVRKKSAFRGRPQ